MSPSTRSLALLAVLGLLQSACLTSDVHLRLGYFPKEAEHPKPATAGIPSATAEPPKLFVVTFEDPRRDKARIGYVGERFPGKKFYAFADNSVAEWLTDGVAKELEGAGFAVLRVAEPPESSDRPIVKGEIIEVYSTPVYQYIGHVEFAVRVERNGREIFGKTYENYDGSIGTWDFNSERFAWSLSRALQKAARQFAVNLYGIPEAH